MFLVSTFCKQSKKKKPILKNQNWKVVRKKSTPTQAKVLACRFVYKIMKIFTLSKLTKSRYGSQGSNVVDQAKFVLDTGAIRPTSIWIILYMLRFLLNFFLHDDTQRYLQSKNKLPDRILIRVKIISLQLWNQIRWNAQSFKGLYELCDPGHYRIVMIEEHVMNDSEMKQLVIDPQLNVKFSKIGLQIETSGV